MKKQLFLTFALLALQLFLSNCRLPDSFGFYQPITMSMAVPDGPPEYKAGWHGGCRSGLAARGTSAFANASPYLKGAGPSMGNGVYQHDPAFQTGWAQGWFSCVIHANTFTGLHAMRYSPLGK